MHRYGVIDLGTNTFHLLIVEFTDNKSSFKEIYRERIFVKLAEDGIHTIGNAPLERATKALIHFKSIIDKYIPIEIKAFGTAALRTASNGNQFINTIKELTEIDIQLISGDQEAQLIYKGVQQVVPFHSTYSMIMDIGGGSVEFIIANEDGIAWAKSFPVGVAVLHRNFHHSDPINSTDIASIQKHLSEILAPLIDILPKYPVQILVGASGTFDVLEHALEGNTISDSYTQITVEQFYHFYNECLPLNLSERFNHPKIPDSRADLITVALVLIHFILQNTFITHLDISAFAMKEGMLADMNSN